MNGKAIYRLIYMLLPIPLSIPSEIRWARYLPDTGLDW
jgi:hypothetical protein